MTEYFFIVSFAEISICWYPRLLSISTGFVSTTDACCGLGKYGGMVMCLFPEMACKNATNHVWWDEFHPTEAVNLILADDVWSGKHIDMCLPMNLRDMIAHKT